MGKKTNHKAYAEPAPQPSGWCPVCSMPTIERGNFVLKCRYGHEYSKREEVHIPPSDGGDAMDDIDVMVLQMERMEGASPAGKLKRILAKISEEFGNSPPPEDEDNELTEEEKAKLQKILKSADEPETYNEDGTPVNMYTAPAKLQGE